MTKDRASHGMPGRPRSHVIGDLAVEFTRLLIIEAGCSPLCVEQGHDYGIDVPMTTFAANGWQEPGYVFLQVRASERVRIIDNAYVTARVDRKHILQWWAEPMPVIVVRYDASLKRAYWLYVQRYLAGLPTFDTNALPRQMTLRVPVKHVLTRDAIIAFSEYKRSVILQTFGVVRHA